MIDDTVPQSRATLTADEKLLYAVVTVGYFAKLNLDGQVDNTMTYKPFLDAIGVTRPQDPWSGKYRFWAADILDRAQKLNALMKFPLIPLPEHGSPFGWIVTLEDGKPGRGCYDRS
jgi:hypothetical protein